VPSPANAIRNASVILAPFPFARRVASCPPRGYSATVSSSEPDFPPPDFVVVDVETACARSSSICQIGIVAFRDGREVLAWESLVDPRDEFSAFNTRIHGIAAHHVDGAPCFAQVHHIVDAYLSGRLTVAHSSFDRHALARACAVHERDGIATRWIDSVTVARRAWPHLPNHKLGTLARHLGLDHRHHDALSDARAAGHVVLHAIAETGVALADWLNPPPRRKRLRETREDATPPA
jgi:DNA polymerase-3 subunit epsilon